jgi:hypothetical protein
VLGICKVEPYCPLVDSIGKVEVQNGEEKLFLGQRIEVGFIVDLIVNYFFND